MDPEGGIYVASGSRNLLGSDTLGAERALGWCRERKLNRIAAACKVPFLREKGSLKSNSASTRAISQTLAASRIHY
jgi:hypothetical protein